MKELIKPVSGLDMDGVEKIITSLCEHTGYCGINGRYCDQFVSDVESDDEILF